MEQRGNLPHTLSRPPPPLHLVTNMRLPPPEGNIITIPPPIVPRFSSPPTNLSQPPPCLTKPPPAIPPHLSIFPPEIGPSRNLTQPPPTLPAQYMPRYTPPSDLAGQLVSGTTQHTTWPPDMGALNIPPPDIGLSPHVTGACQLSVPLPNLAAPPPTRVPPAAEVISHLNRPPPDIGGHIPIMNAPSSDLGDLRNRPPPMMLPVMTLPPPAYSPAVPPPTFDPNSTAALYHKGPPPMPTNTSIPPPIPAPSNTFNYPPPSRLEVPPHVHKNYNSHEMVHPGSDVARRSLQSKSDHAYRESRNSSRRSHGEHRSHRSRTSPELTLARSRSRERDRGHDRRERSGRDRYERERENHLQSRSRDREPVRSHDSRGEDRMSRSRSERRCDRGSSSSHHKVLSDRERILEKFRKNYCNNSDEVMKRIQNPTEADAEETSAWYRSSPAELHYITTEQNIVKQTPRLMKLCQTFSEQLLERGRNARPEVDELPPLEPQKPHLCNEDDDSSSSDDEKEVSPDDECLKVEADRVMMELQRKQSHPRRLHPEMWYNNTGEMNGGPLCRCNHRAKRLGMRHGVFADEPTFPPCDLSSNNLNKLYHYRLTVTPATNFLIRTPTIITHDEHEFLFSGFSMFTHYKLDDIPMCKVIRFNIEYTIMYVEEPAPKNFTIQELKLFEEFVFTEILELVDLDLGKATENSCSQFHFMPRFVRSLQDGGSEILSMCEIMRYLLKENQLLIDPEHLKVIHDMDHYTWQRFIDKFKGMIVTCPGKKPCSIRVDQLDRTPPQKQSHSKKNDKPTSNISTCKANMEKPENQDSDEENDKYNEDEEVIKIESSTTAEFGSIETEKVQKSTCNATSENSCYKMDTDISYSNNEVIICSNKTKNAKNSAEVIEGPVSASECMQNSEISSTQNLSDKEIIAEKKSKRTTKRRWTDSNNLPTDSNNVSIDSNDLLTKNRQDKGRSSDTENRRCRTVSRSHSRERRSHHRGSRHDRIDDKHERSCSEFRDSRSSSRDSTRDTHNHDRISRSSRSRDSVDSRDHRTRHSSSDRYHRAASESSCKSSDDMKDESRYKFFPEIVHFGIRPPQLSYAGNQEYQTQWRYYVKLRHLVANQPKPTVTQKKELKSCEEKLQQMRTQTKMKRGVTVAVSSEGFYATGLMCDVVQHAMLIPVLVRHLRFHKSLDGLEKKIKYTFASRSLLQKALTHPSFRENYGTNPDHAKNSLTNCGIRQPEYGDRKIHYTNTRKKGINILIDIMSRLGEKSEKESAINHNERLEFLGDAVVEFLSSIHLFKMFPALAEGGLATFRAAIVQNQHLAILAQNISLEKYMLFAHGSDLCREVVMRHAMANCFEALMGAVFLDGGLTAADNVFALALWMNDPIQYEVWTRPRLHPLQEEEPLGDRHLIEQNEHLKRLTKFEESTNMYFHHIRLLARAFTDRSVGFTHLTLGSNQRLEFLGDTVLQLLVSALLYKHFPHHHEGHLSLLRSSLVNNRTQAIICDHLDMAKYALYSSPKARPKTKKHKADLLEAFLGAFYIDKGLEYCQCFCDVVLFPHLEEFIMNQDWNDPKSKLQQCCLTLRSMKGGEPDIPIYKVIESLGPTNIRVYTVAVYFRGTRLASARGHSIQEAEMNAAQKALENAHELFPQLDHQKRIVAKSKNVRNCKSRKSTIKTNASTPSTSKSLIDDRVPKAYRKNDGDWQATSSSSDDDEVETFEKNVDDDASIDESGDLMDTDDDTEIRETFVEIPADNMDTDENDENTTKETKEFGTFETDFTSDTSEILDDSDHVVIEASDTDFTSDLPEIWEDDSVGCAELMVHRESVDEPKKFGANKNKRMAALKKKMVVLHQKQSEQSDDDSDND